jgi:hypothetical protein
MRNPLAGRSPQDATGDAGAYSAANGGPVSPPGRFPAPRAAFRRPRLGDFCPGPLFGQPLRSVAEASLPAMQPLGGRRFPAIAGAASSAVVPGLLDFAGSNTRARAVQAPAARHVGCWIRRPVAGKRRISVGRGRAGGDKRRAETPGRSAVSLNESKQGKALPAGDDVIHIKRHML